MEPDAGHISSKPCAVNRDLSLAQRYAEVREAMNLKFVRQVARKPEPKKSWKRDSAQAAMLEKVIRKGIPVSHGSTIQRKRSAVKVFENQVAHQDGTA